MQPHEEFVDCSRCSFDRYGLNSILEETKVKVLTPVPVPCDITTKEVIKAIAKLRHEFNEKDLSKSHNNDWVKDAHLLGAFGEYVYEVLTGTPMDKSIGRRNPYDFKHGDIEVDAKCSRSGKYLYVKKKRLSGNERSNYLYVYAEGDPDKYTAEFKGWISGEDFYKIHKPYPANPESLSVPIKSLNPMNELYDMLKKGGHLNGNGIWK